MKTRRLVYVTGAGRGIGRTIALHLAARGYAVSGCARSRTELDETARLSGGRVRVSAVDVTDLRAQEEWIEAEACACDAVPWGLVTAAGVYGPIGSFIDNDLSEWRKALDINLYGTVYSARVFAKALVAARRPGRIVLLSGGGATKPMPNFSSYAATKAAIVRWGETLALELAPHRIAVNSLAPGAVHTKLTQEVIAAGPGQAGQAMFDAALKQAEEGGQDPRKAAELVEYLFGEQGSGITGRLISAIWDDWHRLHEGDALKSPDVYTLRRQMPTG